MSSNLRIGIVGLGNIGRQHAELLGSGVVRGAVLTAVSSPRLPTDLDLPNGVTHFSDYRALMASNLVDAVIVATPTMSHVEIGLCACEHGLHVLMEKPVAMSVQQISVLQAAQGTDQVIGVMLNQRHHPHYAEIKSIIERGLLGDLNRVAWSMTAWYRPDIYYQVSTWRGTWPGEGGGLLLNQCIHNLDVLQWLVGLPSRVTAQIGFGQYHEIEVEDDVSALLEFSGGLNGTLVASSGEAPGINQLDIVGDKGTLQFDGKVLTMSLTDTSIGEHCRTTHDMFGMPIFTESTVEVAKTVHQHAQVMQNFVDAVHGHAELQTPLEAGIPSVEFANALLLSAWRSSPISLPLAAAEYESELQARIARTSLRKASNKSAYIDMESSYR